MYCLFEVVKRIIFKSPLHKIKERKEDEEVCKDIKSRKERSRKDSWGS